MKPDLAMIEEFKTRPADLWLQEWDVFPKSYCVYCRCLGKMVMWKGKIGTHSCWTCFNEVVFEKLPSAALITGPDKNTPGGFSGPREDGSPWGDNAVRDLEDQR